MTMHSMCFSPSNVQSLDSNILIKNTKNYPQRCYAFVAEKFHTSSEDQHIKQLEDIVNLCAQISEDAQNESAHEMATEFCSVFLLNVTEQTKTMKFSRMHTVLTLLTLSLTTITANLCRAIYGWKDGLDQWMPRRVEVVIVIGEDERSK
jgi:hypothetical protein